MKNSYLAIPRSRRGFCSMRQNELYGSPTRLKAMRGLLRSGTKPANSTCSRTLGSSNNPRHCDKHSRAWSYGRPPIRQLALPNMTNIPPSMGRNVRMALT